MEEFQCKYYVNLLKGVFEGGLHVCDVIRLKEDNEEDNSLVCKEGYGQVKIIGDYNGSLGACIPFCNSIYQNEQEKQAKSKPKKQKIKLTKGNKSLITKVISANGEENLQAILINNHGFSEKDAQRLQTKYTNFKKQSA